TVYEKGGEVIRMLKRIIGAEAFDKGMQLYFERRDGTASTVEDFIACFAEASGKDLAQFMRWYEQAGTPALTSRGVYDGAAKTYALTVTQNIAPTPGQPTKAPPPIPLSVSFISADGERLTTKLDGAARSEHAVVLDTQEATYHFAEVPSEPIPAILRGFSAP